jgi:hypothetical protein
MPVHAFAAGESPMMSAASEADAALALRQARAVFGHTLASWASDMLLLQKRGLHMPSWDGDGAPFDLATHGLRKAA